MNISALGPCSVFHRWQFDKSGWISRGDVKDIKIALFKPPMFDHFDMTGMVGMVSGLLPWGNVLCPDVIGIIEFVHFAPAQPRARGGARSMPRLQAHVIHVDETLAHNRHFAGEQSQFD